MNPKTIYRQMTFNPTNFTFKFTDDGWYKFDSKTAHQLARKARRAEAKALKEEGFTVKLSTLSNQLVTLGGIGTGFPQIEQIVSIYLLDATKTVKEAA